MSALDDLERTLARAVTAGAAADPAHVAARDQASAAARAATTTERSADVHRAATRRHAPRVARRPWHLLIAILLAGGVTTGSLAATGVLRVAKARQLSYFLALPNDPGTPVSPLTVLPMRITDPGGGPPWALRTFQTTRKAACVQAGQLYDGHFGQVEYDKRGRKIFRLRGTSAPDYGIACSTPHAGQPIEPGIQQPILDLKTPNCIGSQQSDGPCAIVGERVLAFGALGPDATSVTFVRPDGTRTAPRPVDPGTGAYLFMEKIDPRPAQRLADFQAADRAEIDRRFPRRPYGSIPKAQRPAEDRRWRARLRFVHQLAREHRAEVMRLAKATYQGSTVEATFKNGKTITVSGGGITGTLTDRELPGVPPADIERMPSVSAPVTVKYRGPHTSVQVFFPAPVALDRFTRSYFITVRGPLAPVCGRHLDSSSMELYRAKLGQVVRGSVNAKVVATGNGTAQVRIASRKLMRQLGWCPGRTYTARVYFQDGDTPGRTPGPHPGRLVGSKTFVAR